MKALIQRVKSANVKVENKIIGEIEEGILVFLGVGKGDDSIDVSFLADKIVNLRIFEDDNGKMNLSIIDKGHNILVVSQFTLYGNCQKGRRPSFDKAANPKKAKKLYIEFIEYIKKKYKMEVETGEFAAMMDVELINDGPVTFMIESKG